MFNTKSIFILALFILIFIAGGFFFFKSIEGTTIASVIKDQTSGIFFVDSVDTEDLKNRYLALKDDDSKFLRKLRRYGKKTDPIKILIVPGHDSQHKGANYGYTNEVDLNRELGQRLYDFLYRDGEFDVILAHQDNEYHPELQKYFETEGDSIKSFREEYQKEMEKLVSEGKVDLVKGVFHNSAPSEAAFRLYGINKWANDNDIDIVLHVHFNDYPGRLDDIKEKYSGFSIYIPEKQFSNSKASRNFAESLFDQLNNISPVSNHALEAEGVIEDQELIAIGAYNTLDAVSVLVEYGYIYEPQFHGMTRSYALSELAYQTYVGIKSFFGDTKEVKLTRILPYKWKKDIEPGIRDSQDVYALQTLLHLQGIYPPQNNSFNDCQITGDFNNCLLVSLKAFQKLNDIQPSGTIGPATRTALHNTFVD